jgi:TROVE domain
LSGALVMKLEPSPPIWRVEMSKNNRGTVKAAVSSPVTSEETPSGRTALGAPGYARDLQSELFLLAAGNLPGEKAFHEGTDARVRRFRELVREASATVPDWTAGLLGWLRGPGNLRLAPVEAAAEFAYARRDTGAAEAAVTVREVVGSVLQRGDEPGEILAYWLSRYGRKMPIGLKRGVADGVFRLYDEFALLKYDTREAAVRFGDVIEIANPRYLRATYGTWRDDLYRYAIERRHNRDNPVPERLAMIRANAAIRARAAEDPAALADAEALKAAGMTWQNALSMAGDRVPKADLWTALSGNMGYMALLRNLRNFDEAGVPDDVAAIIAARLADPEQVAKSRQFPFRFLSAYRAAPSLRWAYPLEKALNLSLAGIPELKGRTLVLVDRSPSMWDQKFSEHSDMPWADAAAVFGAALALRAGHADLVEFWGSSKEVAFRKADSVLKLAERFSYQPAPGGTDIPSAVRAHLRPDHTRVVIVTDEQTQAGWLPSNMHHQHGGMPPTLIDDLIPRHVPLYMWNFGGYKLGAAPSGHGARHTFGGLTDSAFRMVPLLESGRDATWPWAEPAS